MPRRLVSALFILCSLYAASAAAQFQQYTQPGSLAERPASPEEKLKQASEDARWRLGPLRLAPWIGLRDLAFVGNVFATDADEVSDLTVTAGAGLRAYLPTGRKAMWAAHALPAYIYWVDQEDRRRSSGRYGIGYFGYFNRLKLEVGARRTEEQGFVTPESEQRTTTRTDNYSALAEVEVTRLISIFADAYQLESENLDDDLGVPGSLRFARLDRDEEVVRAGVRWQLPQGWSVGAGVERSRADFSTAPERSNEGTSPVLEVRRGGGRLYLLFEAADRQLEPRSGDAFPSYDEITGRALADYELSSRSRIRLYGGRDLTYSISSEWAYANDDRVGLGLRTTLGRDLDVNVFVESGRLDFTALVGSDASLRRDDFSALGASLTVPLRRRASITVGGNRTEYDSNLPGFDRTVTSIRSSINIRGGDTAWY